MCRSNVEISLTSSSCFTSLLHNASFPAVAVCLGGLFQQRQMLAPYSRLCNTQASVLQKLCVAMLLPGAHCCRDENQIHVWQIWVDLTWHEHCHMLCRMIPHKTKRGAAALERLRTFEGIPPPYDKRKRMVIPDALKVLRLQHGHRYCKLGDLSHSVRCCHLHVRRPFVRKHTAVTGSGWTRTWHISNVAGTWPIVVSDQLKSKPQAILGTLSSSPTVGFTLGLHS